MSLDSLRDAHYREKKNEIARCELSRKRKLRELYTYTALLNAGHLPPVHEWAIPDPPSEIEARFLDDNDIAKGRRFNDATLPFPVLPSPLPQLHVKSVIASLSKSSPSINVGSTLEDQLRAASNSPSVATQPSPSVDQPAQVNPSAVINPSGTPSLIERLPQPVPSHAESQVDSHPDEARKLSSTKSSEPLAVQDLGQERTFADGPPVDPDTAAPNLAEEVASVSKEVSSEKVNGDKPKAPQVAHLPPQEEQEARLQETERKLEKAAENERKEDERLGLPSINGTADLVSSPSSTVGPYSQATPHAPHHSPDTSPDTESFHEPLQTSPNDGLLNPATQQAKQDHERALHEQMQEARDRAGADVVAEDDVEKQIEDEQAVRLSRDGTSRLDQSDVAPVVGPEALTGRAGDVVREIEIEAENVTTGSEPATDCLPTPTTTAPESSTVELENAENADAKSLQHTSLGLEHPTPPADDDVEMDEAPSPTIESQALDRSPGGSKHITIENSPGIIQANPESEMAGQLVHSPSKAAPTPQFSDISQSASPQRSTKKQKRKVSTVIFAKPDVARATKALQLYNEDYASLQGASQDSSRDYLEGLFHYQAHHPPRSVPLQDLVASARKTLSTAGTLAMIREAQDYKILKRVYHLQNANRWSLRQLKKSAEPERPQTHLDHLLAEMKWMQTDFREERKWKKALAAIFAEWCAEYVNGSPEERVSLRIRARTSELVNRNTADEDMNDAPTPDLILSGANETESESYADDEELLSPLSSTPPAGLFSLGFNDVVMKINWTPSCGAMLRELPAYEPIIDGSTDVTPLAFVEPPILPVSKFVNGKLVSQVRGPPRKRSRYDYDSEDEPSTPPSRPGTSAEHSMPSTPGRRLFHRNDLPPESTEVALFNPENRHIRDRLQAAHQFRPPTEFPMPSVSFFENRSSSQWLWEEDQKLRALVKEYTFNWSLVAQQLALPSLFVAGSGRRTPWECFERWVQLEGLPAEMSKTQYFRTYQSRLEQAQRTVAAQHQAQQQLLQQQAQNSQSIPNQTPRRRTTQPIRVERRRENRHLAIIDGMRKLARKRESLAHKQAESQKAAALRKAHEAVPPKTNVHTPQEFSRLKWEREERLKQKAMVQEMHARQMVAQRQQMQAQGMANGVNQRNGTPGSNLNTTAQMANTPQPGPSSAATNAAMTVRAQQNQAMQPSFPNANMNGGMMMGSSGIPQAQMQSNMSNGQRMAPPDQVRMAMQQRGGQFPNANQQNQFQLQQQQINMASNLTQNMTMGNMPNANMIPMSGQNMNGNVNPSLNGMANNAGSPRINQANATMQTPVRPLSSGHMPQLLQIQNNLKVQHPEWSQEQVQKIASDHLTRFLTKQRAQAMTAAAGSTGLAQSPQVGNNMYLNGGMGANSPSPNAVQHYQQQLVRQQQLMSQQRAQAGSPGMSARPPSRSATPQNPQLQQSPSLPQAQMNRG